MSDTPDNNDPNGFAELIRQHAASTINGDVLVPPKVALTAVSRHELVNLLVDEMITKVEDQIEKLTGELGAAMNEAEAKHKATEAAVYGLYRSRVTSDPKWALVVQAAELLTKGSEAADHPVEPFFAGDTVASFHAYTQTENRLVQRAMRRLVCTPAALTTPLPTVDTVAVGIAAGKRPRAPLLETGWIDIDATLPDDLVAQLDDVVAARDKAAAIKAEIDRLAKSIADPKRLERKALARLTRESFYAHDVKLPGEGA